MTLTNHLLTGAVLSKFLPLPVALPLAFASHFVLDALPHFGFPNEGVSHKHSRRLYSVIALDFIVGIIIAVWLINDGHPTWLLGGLVAFSPDLMWIYRFAIPEKFGKLPASKGNLLVQFHTNIQKYERQWGIFVELVYGTVLFTVLW